MSKKESPETALLIDVMNGTGAIIMIVVGVLLLRDGLADSEIPFLLFGLLLTAIGTFRITYRVNKGKWFRIFGRRDNAGQ